MQSEEGKKGRSEFEILATAERWFSKAENDFGERWRAQQRRLRRSAPGHCYLLLLWVFFLLLPPIQWLTRLYDWEALDWLLHGAVFSAGLCGTAVSAYLVCRDKNAALRLRMADELMEELEEIRAFLVYGTMEAWAGPELADGETPVPETEENLAALRSFAEQAGAASWEHLKKKVSTSAAFWDWPTARVYGLLAFLCFALPLPLIALAAGQSWDAQDWAVALGTLAALAASLALLLQSVRTYRQQLRLVEITGDYFRQLGELHQKCLETLRKDAR